MVSQYNHQRDLFLNMFHHHKMKSHIQMSQSILIAGQLVFTGVLSLVLGLEFY
ncbi:hypothetical protein OHW09_09910 [Acinetobacter baumannii]|nr:hypothetical protein [Acinetobacter baumannii]